MPRLAKGLAKTVADAEAVTGAFELIKPGKYIATLKQVESKTSGTGKPGWNWEFGDILDLEGKKVPGRQWLWTMLPGAKAPKDESSDEYKKWETSERLSAGRIKGIFEAFGFETDSDTDEMLGEKIVLQIGIQTIKAGPKKGEEQNYIVKLIPFNEGDFEDINFVSENDEDDDDF